MSERMRAWPGRKAILSILICMLYEWALMRLAWRKGCFIHFNLHVVWMSADAPSLAERLFYCFNLYAAWMSVLAPDLAKRSFYVWLLYDNGDREQAIAILIPVAFWCALKRLRSRHLLILVFSSLIQLKDMVRGLSAICDSILVLGTSFLTSLVPIHITKAWLIVWLALYPVHIVCPCLILPEVCTYLTVP